MPYAHVIIGACLQILGWGLAVDTFAELPWCPPGLTVESNLCTTSILGEATEVPDAPGQCWLPAPIEDTSYSFVWCQPVHVNGVDVTTPCPVDIIAREDTPYAYRVHFADLDCPQWLSDWGMCTRVNPCTPADELAELCTMDPPA